MNAQLTKRPDLTTQTQLAVDAALDRKAIDLQVLDLAKVSDFTDCFLICSGSNERQVQAIAEAILGVLRDHGVRPLNVEGLDRGQWVLLDYGGSLVVHVFLEATRQFYDLERLWSDAPRVTGSFVQSNGADSNGAKTNGAGSSDG